MSAVAQRGADVHRELVLAAERDERRQRDAAPRAAVEAGPRPDLAPGVAGDQVLEVGRELGRPLDRAVDVLVAEHLAARLHAPRVVVVTSCAHARRPEQVLEQRLGERLGLLDVGEVRGASSTT